MTGAELGFGIFIGVIALILVVFVVTVAVTKANSKEINSIRNVYLGGLANSDESIQPAMKYLKLVNSIKQLNEDKNMKVKGYKAFDKNLMCNDMQYKIGKKYIFDGELIPCEQGYHFCKSIADCYRFYDMSENTRICKILATGEIKSDDGIKYCTNKIKIIREIKNPLKKTNVSKTSSGYCNSGSRNIGNWNSGKYNIGSWNSGDYNTGKGNSGCSNSGNYNTRSWNSGDYNTGSHNSGNMNSGYHNSGNSNNGSMNSGYYNSGDMNSGDSNTGDMNTGNHNSGNWNSGNSNSGNSNSGCMNSGSFNNGFMNSGSWNSGNHNSGLFNTDKDPKIKIFDIESEWTMNNWYNSPAYQVMSRCPYTYSNFISEKEMTEEEKVNHPEYKLVRGYTETFIVTNEKRQAWWDNLSDEDKQAVYSIPNFDADKFEMCTGIKPTANTHPKNEGDEE